MLSRPPIIAVVCDVIHPYSHGGREHRYQQLLPRLAERAEVHVYTMHWWDGPAVYQDDGVTYHAISPLLPLYTGNRRSIRQALLFGLASLRLLRCKFDLLEADHIPYFQVFVLRLVASIKRRPFAVTWHEVWSRSYWREYLGLAGWLAWSVERIAMRLPDRIVAASPETAERLQRMLGASASIITLPNGVDLDVIRSAYPVGDSCDLVTVGRLLGHKRVDLLLEIVALMRRRGVVVTCRIIGDGPERAALEEQSRLLGLEDLVEFRPDVREQKELYGLVKSASIFVSLSTREGFGIAVLEAIACGLAVLTTSAPDNLAQHLVARYSRGVVCDPTAHAVAVAAESLLADGCAPSWESSDDPVVESWIAEYDSSTIADRLASVYLK